MSDEARNVLGLQSAPSDYSEVKALTPEQIAALTIEERKYSDSPFTDRRPFTSLSGARSQLVRE